MKYSFIASFLILILSVCAADNYGPMELSANNVSISDLTVEYFTNPIGIDDEQPRLAWQISSNQRNTIQKAYQLQVSTDTSFTGSNIVWDTGKVKTDKSVYIRYKGPDLTSRQRYYWRVRVWDNHGGGSTWSKPAFWEMGLLNTKEWQAQWISPDLKQDKTKPQPSPILRREFNLEDNIRSARAYVTSQGLYKMNINGKKVGNQLFTPGWTSYNQRLQYQTYDVTDLLHSGANVIGVTLGDGWYRGWIGFNDQRNFYGSKLRLLSQVEITYENGETEIIGTDGSWNASTGAILMSDIYDGEIYDARQEKKAGPPLSIKMMGIGRKCKLPMAIKRNLWLRKVRPSKRSRNWNRWKS